MLFFLGAIAEEKKHKLSELKTGLDEAESLVWYFFWLNLIYMCHGVCDTFEVEGMLILNSGQFVL
jgi:hypothetical protein